MEPTKYRARGALRRRCRSDHRKKVPRSGAGPFAREVRAPRHRDRPFYGIVNAHSPAASRPRASSASGSHATRPLATTARVSIATRWGVPAEAVPPERGRWRQRRKQRGRRAPAPRRTQPPRCVMPISSLGPIVPGAPFAPCAPRLRKLSPRRTPCRPLPRRDQAHRASAMPDTRRATTAPPTRWQAGEPQSRCAHSESAPSHAQGAQHPAQSARERIQAGQPRAASARLRRRARPCTGVAAPAIAGLSRHGAGTLDGADEAIARAKRAAAAKPPLPSNKGPAHEPAPRSRPRGVARHATFPSEVDAVHGAGNVGWSRRSDRAREARCSGEAAATIEAPRHERPPRLLPRRVARHATFPSEVDAVHGAGNVGWSRGKYRAREAGSRVVRRVNHRSAATMGDTGVEPVTSAV